MIGDVIVIAILVVVFTLVIRTMIKTKKAGKSLECGMDCSHCKGCHSNMKEQTGNDRRKYVKGSVGTERTDSRTAQGKWLPHHKAEIDPFRRDSEF